MADTGPPSGGHDPGDLAARLADAEERLAIAERFQKEQLAVLTRALAAAEEIETRAQREAAAIIDRARLDVTVLEHAATRLRLGNPDLAQAIRAMRQAATRAAETAPPSNASAAQSELEAARKRLAIYEGFEDTIQSVLTTALRSAQEIRSRSEEESAAAAERLRAELRSVRDELGQVRAERDAIAEIVAGLQGARDDLLRQHSDLEAAIAALKDDREGLRAAAMAEDERLERRRTERREAEHAPPRAVPAATGAIPAGKEREGLAALRSDIAEDIERLRAERTAMARERDYQSDEVMRLRAERDAVAQQLVGLREAFAAALQQLVRTVAQAPVGTPIPAAAEPAAAAAPAAPPIPAAPAAPMTAAEGELRLVIAPVASFSALLDVERRLQGFAGIRSVYVRDFRAGTATLTLNVAGVGSLQDLADTLAREVGATVERVAEGVIELKAKPAASDTSQKLTG